MGRVRNILALGDIVGDTALEKVCSFLPAFRRENDILLTVVNGENAACGRGNGITADQARQLQQSGADIITTGNHVWAQRSIYDFLDESPYILRPANYPSACPGRGYTLFDAGEAVFLCANISGRVNLDGQNASCPFECADAILAREKGKYDVAIFDFHAEATSEKFCFASYLDGRAGVVFGTHTHVQTADERILPKGTGFITDVGMCGAAFSALGVETSCVTAMFRNGMPQKFLLSGNDTEISGAVFSLDIDTGKTVAVRRVFVGAK